MGLGNSSKDVVSERSRWRLAIGVKIFLRRSAQTRNSRFSSFQPFVPQLLENSSYGTFSPGLFVKGLNASRTQVSLQGIWSPGGLNNKGSNMVGHDVHDEAHVPFVQFCGQGSEGVLCSNVRLNIEEVLSIVARVVQGLHNGCNPNAIEPHALDVVQAIDDTSQESVCQNGG